MTLQYALSSAINVGFRMGMLSLHRAHLNSMNGMGTSRVSVESLLPITFADAVDDALTSLRGVVVRYVKHSWRVEYRVRVD